MSEYDDLEEFSRFDFKGDRVDGGSRGVKRRRAGAAEIDAHRRAARARTAMFYGGAGAGKKRPVTLPAIGGAK